jgi:hypothetical protein
MCLYHVCAERDESVQGGVRLAEHRDGCQHPAVNLGGVGRGRCEWGSVNGGRCKWGRWEWMGCKWGEV